MTQDRQAHPELGRLPTVFVDRLTRPFTQFLRIEAASGVVLLFFTIAALVLSNGPWSSHYFATWETEVGFKFGSLEFGRSLREWINDGLMTLFFFLVALELKRELVLGELNNPRTAALSIAAALGGMLVPAGLYLSLQSGHPGQAGWGTVMATDTAFVIGCLALLGSHSSKPAGIHAFVGHRRRHRRDSRRRARLQRYHRVGSARLRRGRMRRCARNGMARRPKRSNLFPGR